MTGDGSGALVSAPDVTVPVALPEQPAPTVVKVSDPLVIPSTYGEALALGKVLAAKGDHVRAREVLEAAAKLDKKQSEPHIELARLFIANNERANALKAATKAVKLAPDSSQAYNTLGRAELLRFNYENAIVAFRQATDLNADNVWAWNNLGYAYLQLKKYDEAVDVLSEATSRKDATGYMWNNLGTAYEHLDQLDDARDAFDKGGELGSVAAKSSRKRLDGVDTIVVMKTDPVEKTYEDREEMPEVVEPVSDEDVDGDVTTDAAAVHDEVRAEAPDPEVKPEASPVDAPKVDAPKVEAPVDAAVPVI